jgi:hypothetical protein
LDILSLDVAEIVVLISSNICIALLKAGREVLNFDYSLKKFLFIMKKAVKIQ